MALSKKGQDNLRGRGAPACPVPPETNGEGKLTDFWQTTKVNSIHHGEQVPSALCLSVYLRVSQGTCLGSQGKARRVHLWVCRHPRVLSAPLRSFSDSRVWFTSLFFSDMKKPPLLLLRILHEFVRVTEGCSKALLTLGGEAARGMQRQACRSHCRVVIKRASPDPSKADPGEDARGGREQVKGNRKGGLALPS